MMSFSRFLSLMLTLVTFSMISITRSNVNCITGRSASKSLSQDDETITASCNDATIGTLGYNTLTGCGFETYDSGSSYVDGSYGNGTICTAQNGNFGNGVYAWARCCNFTEYTNDISCIRKSSTSSSGDDDATTSVTCSNSNYLTGCSYSSWYYQNDGSYPGIIAPRFQVLPNPLGPYRTCSAQNGDGGTSGITAEALCCSSQKIGLECYTYFSSKSTTGEVTYSCPNDYFMTSCTGYNIFHEMNAAYVDSNNDCYVRSHGSNDLYAVAICCRIATFSPTTASPTTSTPTLVPTTGNPTFLPTTMAPATNSPTTFTPTTIVPTTSIPTILPSKFPSNLPSSAPTTSIPSNSPTSISSTILISIFSSITSYRPTTYNQTSFTIALTENMNDEMHSNSDQTLIIVLSVCIVIFMMVCIGIGYKVYRINSKLQHETNLHNMEPVNTDLIKPSIENNVNIKVDKIENIDHDIEDMFDPNLKIVDVTTKNDIDKQSDDDSNNSMYNNNNNNGNTATLNTTTGDNMRTSSNVELNDRNEQEDIDQSEGNVLE